MRDGASFQTQKILGGNQVFRKAGNDQPLWSAIDGRCPILLAKRVTCWCSRWGPRFGITHRRCVDLILKQWCIWEATYPYLSQVWHEGTEERKTAKALFRSLSRSSCNGSGNGCPSATPWAPEN